VEKEAALWACKVMPVDPQTGKPTRVRFKIDGTNKKVRIAKSGEEIPIAQTD
jgi:large subunit ribosomal protein L24